MLFAVCCDRGAPGATTTALALAAARGKPAVVVEADPYGGDLALRLRPEGRALAATPTVLGMGAGRSTQKPAELPLVQAGEQRLGEPRHLDLWRSGSHQLSDTVRVVPGFLTAEQGSSLAWGAVTATLASQSVPVFADIGRIHAGSPSMPIAAAADALIMVCRGNLGSVQHMIWRLEQLAPAIAEKNGQPPLVLPVVVTGHRSGARHAGQIAELLADTAAAPTIRGVGWIAWDPAAVDALVEGGDPWATPLRRSKLMQSARKAMWHLGLATGIDHATPEEMKRGRRRASASSEAQQPMRPAMADGAGEGMPAGMQPSWSHNTQPTSGPTRAASAPGDREMLLEERHNGWAAGRTTGEGS